MVRCSQPRPSPAIARGDAQQRRPCPAAHTALSHPAAPAALWLSTPHKLHATPCAGLCGAPGACPQPLLSVLVAPTTLHSGPSTLRAQQRQSPPPLASCSQQAACGRSLRRAVRRTQGLVSQPLLCARGSDHTPQRAQPARTHSSASGHPGFPLPTSRTPQPAPGCVAHMLLYHVARR